jgi:hypothetical protein
VHKTRIKTLAISIASLVALVLAAGAGWRPN